MRRDNTERKDCTDCASKKVGSPMNELCCCFQRPIRIFNKKIASDFQYPAMVSCCDLGKI